VGFWWFLLFFFTWPFKKRGALLWLGPITWR